MAHPRLLLSLPLALPLAACVVPGQKPKMGDDVAALTAECGPDGLVDDMEDNNNQTAVVEGRGGYWYTYVDDAGSTIEPTAGSQGGTFEQAEGGANGSKFAARMKGTLAGAQINYAAMGMNFVDPRDEYDVGKYKGISFWAKKGPGSRADVRVKFPDIHTDGDGGECSVCDNNFGVDLKLTDSWKKYVILWSKTRQQEGWGQPRPRKLDTKTVRAIHWQVQGAPGGYDIWVDDVNFVGCGADE